jgi:pentatricopeptide repeat protein
VVAVDSSLGGRLWPVSTVEGVVSAVTARLPGQQITLRFQRPEANMSTIVAPMVLKPRSTAVTVASPPIDQKALIKRCQDIIRRYMSKEQQQMRDKFVDKYAVPAMVADKVLDALASAGTSVDSITLSMIMSAYLSCRQPQGAIRAFEAVVGINANGSALPTTTVLEGKDNKQIVSNLGALNAYTVSALLRAHAINGDLASVKRVLAASEGRTGVEVDGLEVTSWPGTGAGGSVQPDTQCYNIAISAAAETRSKDGLALALQLFDSMSEPTKADADGRPVRDLVSYNTVMSALTLAGRYEKTFALFYEMKRSGVKPDKYSYTSLITTVMSDGEDGDIQELLYDMKEQGVKGDVVTYNTVIKFLCAGRNFVAAKRIVNEMEAASVAPDSMTYGLLMNGLLKAGNPSACVTLFETACADIRTVALTENVHLYTTAITAASALGDHGRAFDLLSRMNALGVKPTIKTLTALMGACISSGKPSLAAEIYRKIENPDGYAMSQGLRAFCLSGAIDEAFAVVSKLDRRSQILSGKQLMLTYKTLIESALKQGDYETARLVLAELMKKGNIPSKDIFATIFDAMNLFPKRRVMLRVASSDSVDKDANEKFNFLLFTLDSVLKRNLPCEGPLYAGILMYGSRLGGLQRKIASLLVSARTATDIAVPAKAIIDETEAPVGRLVTSWEEVLSKYDEYKERLSNPDMLPSLKVRIASSDVPRVLKAEQLLSYSGRSNARR